MSTIALETPLAEALSSAVHAKIVDEGWTQEDDPSLAEYIVLMLANGKTQDQIASELAGELLQDAQGTTEFAQWLFDQVNALSSGGSSVAAAAAQPTHEQPPSTTSLSHPSASEPTDNANTSIPAAYDMDMGDTAPDNAPRGPKGLHGGRPAGRGGRGGMSNKAGDSALHRVRGNDRISSHVRGAPKGPRNTQNRDVRPGMQKALNGMGGSAGAPGMPTSMMQNGGGPRGGQSAMQMTPQQQMEFMAMMEQQARMMAQFIPGMMQQGMNPAFPQGGGHPNGQGRSLFDRVEPGRGRDGRGRGRGGISHQNGTSRNAPKTGDGDTKMDTTDAAPSATTETTSPMEGQQLSHPQRRAHDPSTTMCHFNLRCTNKDCPYVHQSPAAPEGTVVDMSDTCSFGAACKNAKCVGRHPSPAQIKAHQAEELCKYFPNCTNPVCPYKHPSMPLCNFGANCKNPNCKFTHLQTPCRFNPCLNPRCPYKHEPGQNKTFADYTWTAEGAKEKEEQTAREHVSDRKFVADDAGEEELIKPDHNGDGKVEQAVREEVIT